MRMLKCKQHFPVFRDPGNARWMCGCGLVVVGDVEIAFHKGKFKALTAQSNEFGFDVTRGIVTECFMPEDDRYTANDKRFLRSLKIGV